MAKTARQTNKRKKKSNLPFIFLFIIGFGILLYPHISNFYYRFEASNLVSDFDSEKTKIDTAEIAERMRLAHDFNDSLVNAISEDPYARTRYEAGRAEYARMLEINEKIGHIEIPKIDIDIPIYAGTTDEVLEKGSGHLEGTSLPVGGAGTHSVLTAHTGLPKAKLFTDIRELKKGDVFYVHNISEVMAYEVDQIKVVEPSNFEDLLVMPGQDYVTLLTCTPIMVNTHRLLVRGHRIPYEPETHKNDSAQSKRRILIRYALYGLGMLLLILLIFFFTRRRKKKQKAHAQEAKA